jgi:hypothetical protein
MEFYGFPSLLQTKAKPYYRPVPSLLAKAFPPDFNLPKQNPGERKSARVRATEMRHVHAVRFIPGICLASTQGRKSTMVLKLVW